MCMQLAAKVTHQELTDFFAKIGQVRDVKLIADKNSRRSKGIAYVEFYDEKSVPAVSRQHTFFYVLIMHTANNLP